jgi:hypothetical protein
LLWLCWESVKGFLFKVLNEDIPGSHSERHSRSWRTLEAGPLGWATGESTARWPERSRSQRTGLPWKVLKMWKLFVGIAFLNSCF